MDELKTKGLLIGTLAESEYYIQKLNDSIYVKLLMFSSQCNSWFEYWRSAKVPISNPPVTVFELIHQLKFCQMFHDFIGASV